MRVRGRISARNRMSPFADFWPLYVRAHSRPRTRLLHAIGSVSALACIVLSFARSLWFLPAAPLVGYAFAWYSHFFVEHNKPATFGHPFYSLLADYRMVFLMMAGRMNEEVAKFSDQSSVISSQAHPSPDH